MQKDIHKNYDDKQQWHSNQEKWYPISNMTIWRTIISKNDGLALKSSEMVPILQQQNGEE